MKKQYWLTTQEKHFLMALNSPLNKILLIAGVSIYNKFKTAKLIDPFSLRSNRRAPPENAVFTIPAI